MFKTKIILPLMVFFLLSFFLWRGLQADPNYIPSPLVGKKVPQFRARSVFDPTKIITQKIFENHVSIFSVFATWCRYCRAEHPLLLDLAKNHPELWMIGMGYKDNTINVVRYLEDNENPYKVVISDQEGNIGLDFGVYGTPETFIINKQGVIVDKISGMLSEDIIHDEILPLVRKLS